MGKRLSWVLIVAMSVRSICGVVLADRRSDVNDVAESYVKLVLEVGLYDDVYVDTYFGPSQWKPPEAAKEDQFPVERLDGKARELIERLAKIDDRGLTPLERQRRAYLEKQLSSAKAKIELLGGRKMSFDEESKALYDVVTPARDDAHFQSVLDRLDHALPGDDDLYWRFNNYRSQFTVPKDRVEKVLHAITTEYRRRTQEHIALPADERYDLEFVIAKPWGAATTYKGDGLSLIEVNFHMPFGVADLDRLAGHEIYPGHHLHLTLLDTNLVKDRKWMEYSVLPLYSPLALVCEGLAEYGCKDLIMTTAERADFERRVLLPLAGLIPTEMENYQQVMALKDELDGALVEAARRYLDGHMTVDQTREWLRRYYLALFGGVENLITFIEKYRSYVVTYTMGRQLVRDYIERNGGPSRDLARRWRLFHALLSTPQTPSGLRQVDARARTAKRLTSGVPHGRHREQEGEALLDGSAVSCEVH
ncbi:MAG: hypothetical protein JW955_20460 [Sedimentisphaerales bacterium]|nr:hypothetical protein [Sedimentisphaerales bacterium]